MSIHFHRIAVWYLVQIKILEFAGQLKVTISGRAFAVLQSMS